MYDGKCPICNSPSSLKDTNADVYLVSCIRCGYYRISVEARADLSSYIRTPRQYANLSGWIREHQNEAIFSDDLERLSRIGTPTVHEKATKLLKTIALAIPIPGQQLTINHDSIRVILDRIKNDKLLEVEIEQAEQVLPFFAASWSSDYYEFAYLLDTYLYEHLQYLSDPNPVTITPGGWTYLDKLRKANADSQRAFIAMKFDDDLLQYVDGNFFPAIEKAGYKPERINDYQHNNLIDDEIASMIRISRFVVADFTKNSNGVYYEAGFARGLNIPVICLCEKEYFESENVHFDLNHYNFVRWEFGNGLELQKALQLRIESTVGKGSYRKS